jgi:hypothetical protein
MKLLQQKSSPQALLKVADRGKDTTTLPEKGSCLCPLSPGSCAIKPKQRSLRRGSQITDTPKPTSTLAAQSTDAATSSGPKKQPIKTPMEKGLPDTPSPQSDADAKPVQAAPPAPPVLRQKDVTVEEAGLSWEGDVQPSSALSSDSSNKDKNDSNNDDQNPESQSQLATMQTPAPFAIDTPARTGASTHLHYVQPCGP